MEESYAKAQPMKPKLVMFFHAQVNLSFAMLHRGKRDSNDPFLTLSLCDVVVVFLGIT